MPFRVADAVPTRSEGDWSVEGLADRVAAMELVSGYALESVFEGFVPLR